MLVTGLALSGCGVAVPALKDTTLVQARQSIDSAGFAVGEINYDASSTARAGTIIAQMPASGTRAKSGSVLALTVAGYPPVKTPDLVGLDRLSAESSLASAGLVGQVVESYEATVSAGAIASQTPPATELVSHGSTVRITLSKGREPVAVPDVKGRKEAAAKRELEVAGFVVKASKKNDAKVKKGLVIHQSPKGGHSLVPSSTVTITVSKGVEMVRVPDFVAVIVGADNGDGGATATAALNRAAARVGLRAAWSAGSAPTSQSPRAGSLVPKGALVHVTIRGG